MVFNATLNNISAISWRSVLMVEETRVPGENHRPVASHWQTLSYNVVCSTPRLIPNYNCKQYICGTGHKPDILKARISTLMFKNKDMNTNLQKIRTAVLVLGNPAVENIHRICISKHNADWLHYQIFTALLCFNALSELSIFFKYTCMVPFHLAF